MSTILVTGSAGLIGSESARHFAAQGHQVIGIDNDLRSKFFGPDASTLSVRQRLQASIPGYEHIDADIRNRNIIDEVFASYEFSAVIHTAAQPSHDWAASDPHTDFGVNAVGTLNLLEATRRHCPNAAFVFTSTNKVYGDRPNEREFSDCSEDFNIPYLVPVAGPNDGDFQGFDESLSIDQSKHSLFGASKVAADILVQEYGRYFGMPTVAFRCGCLTGPAHAGTKMHGFLSYLVKCAVSGTPYVVIGYQGKQVRDNLHSADLVAAFDEYIQAPRPGEVYNMGGGRENSCSVREAIKLVEEVTGRQIEVQYDDNARQGDHKWWISDTRKFRRDYPGWKVSRSLTQIVEEIVAQFSKELVSA